MPPFKRAHHRSQRANHRLPSAPNPIYDDYHGNNQTHPTRPQASHERILDVVIDAIRRTGYGGTGVAKILRETGLTPGGVYAHFACREALLAEAAVLDRGIRQNLGRED
ncbi:MAG: TetR/AcrR family transcriptional regulator [Pseudomonas sp.]|uniref:TetR/AcrR family transcriptional regulator n=1 Tax=Pseudomonas sp. TaxID=306 RepID=UPI0033924118